MVQFITQGNTVTEHLEYAYRAMDNGIGWVQLRLKDVPRDILMDAASRFIELCRGYRATACLNDHAEIAAELGFDALHLGTSDEFPKTARKRFTEKVLIGGTANSMKDIERINAEVDYIGLGPYRFTTTKKALSPVLGLEGYVELLEKMHASETPIIAIGGIQARDIPALADAGLDGIAVSGHLIEIDFNEKIIREMQRAFTVTKIEDTWID